MTQIILSVAIITFNEETNISRCLDSAAKVADEIVVVDSFSTDKTKEICLEKGVRFLTHRFDGHVQQKNFAASCCTGDYILSLDADEALDDALCGAILSEKRSFSADVYSMNRLTNYCGHWVRHCGWYPDRKFRLWKKGKASWGGENPHDRLIPSQSSVAKHLSGDILHYSFPSIRHHVNTANNFSEIAAKEAVAKGKKIYFLVHVLLNPVFTFFSKYFLRLGFLDGYYGLVICVLSGFANFLKYSKIWALYKGKDTKQP